MPIYQLNGGKFQGSLNNITWVDVYTLNRQILKGWNNIVIKNNNNSYKYFRFIHTS